MTDLRQATTVTRRASRSVAPLADVTVVVTAVLVALADWVLWTEVAGVDLAARSGGEMVHVGAGSVAMAAAVVSVAGVVLMHALRRLQRGLRWWTVVACSVWLLSMLGTAGATSTAAWLGLTSLHVLVGAVVVLGVRHAHRVA